MGSGSRKSLSDWKSAGLALVLITVTAVFASGAKADTIIDNLTGGSSAHMSCIGVTWYKHEWDIIFPVEHWGQQISDPVLYYRLSNQGFDPGVVNAGFTDGDEGAFVVTTVNGQHNTNTTPPGTSETDEYLIFDFAGQTLDIPADGVLWFRFTGTTGDCIAYRDDIGALGTFTTTYQQNDSVRSGGTSFAVFGNPGAVVAKKANPIPTLSQWGLIILSALVGFAVFTRRKMT